MAIIISNKEKAYRAEVARHYASLPKTERGPYAESIGVSRAVISYWNKHYGDGVWMHIRKPEQPKPAKPRKVAAPKPAGIVASRCYEVGRLALADRMRCISVVVADRRGLNPAQRVSTRAEFRNGSIAERPLEALAEKALAVIGAWGYKQPSSEDMRKHIKALWR